MKQAPSTRTWTCLAILSLAAAAFFYLFALSWIVSPGGSDPAGNAMAAGFAAIAEFLLWFPLTAFFLICCLPARLPGMVRTGAIISFGCAAIASIAAVTATPTWVRIAPVLLPPLAALFGIWARYSMETPARTRSLIAIGFAALAVPLMVLPIIGHAAWVAAAPEREAERARREAEYERSVADSRAAEEAAFRALGPGSRLDDYLEFLNSDFGEEAVAEIRSVRSRQADAVRLMGGDTPFYALVRLPEFGLEATPELCGAYRSALDRRLAQFVEANPTFRSIPGELDGQTPNFRWFMANGCDLAPQARRLAAAIRSLPDLYFASHAEELEAIAREGAARTD